ncbi:MAG: aquaporin [Muribaculaceae bacterium]|nr:aquaporin [Muribaculaceae bacterium]
MRKFIAEGIGAMLLILIGCGSAIIMGSATGVWGISLCFIIVLLLLFYFTGHISGCHLTPAVSLAMLLSGRMRTTDFKVYILAQILGSAAGAALLYLLLDLHPGIDVHAVMNAAPQPSPATTVTVTITLIAETMFTLFLLLIVFGATDDNRSFDRYAGLTVNLALCIVNAAGLGFSDFKIANPTDLTGYIRSGGWIILVGPMIGAVAAAACSTMLSEYLSARRRASYRHAGKQNADGSDS